jgi:hypothetical protein
LLVFNLCLVCSMLPVFLDCPFLFTPYLFSKESLKTPKGLLNQWFLLVKLKSSLRKFYGRHHDLDNCYGTSVSQMTTDMFHLSLTLSGPSHVFNLFLVCSMLPVFLDCPFLIPPYRFSKESLKTPMRNFVMQIMLYLWSSTKLENLKLLRH